MPYSYPSDFWNLGIVMYTVLFGEAPFYHEDTFELLQLVKQGHINTETPEW